MQSILKTLGALLFSTTLFLSVQSNAELAAIFTEGEHFKKVPNPQPTKNKEVLEVFWLGCGHCNSLEPKLEKWLASKTKKDFEFKREPAMFGRAWVLHAHLYFIAEALGVEDKMVPIAFDEIHKHNNRLLTKDTQKAFMAQKLGIKPEQFDKVFDSESVRAKMMASNEHIRQLGLTGVPAIIVNGQYIVDAGLAGGQDRMLEVVDYLLMQ